jgi:hypothetical protein
LNTVSSLLGDGLVALGWGRLSMEKDDPRSSPEFDGWLKANAVVGSILTVGMLAMAMAGLYSSGPPADRTTEFSSVARE